jgi:hypothetical protein
MKTVFDPMVRAELISRINTLNEHSTAQWGKMNVYQMLRHCRQWEEWMAKKEQNKQMFIGRLFGKMALKKVLKDEQPLAHSTPTIPQLKIKETNGDIAAEKKRWIALIEQYAHYSNPGFVHVFFGKLSHEQIGYMAYKHSDHHLRQFNS